MIHARTKMLLGEEGLARLKNAHVAVFGVGGVGSYTVEALARGGIGALTLVDGDTVSVSNINRQLVATQSTVGQAKVAVAAAHIRDIDPSIQVFPKQMFYLPENADDLPLEQFDYIVDAVDTVAAKIELIARATEKHIPIISSMGTGNKLHADKLYITDLAKTSVCPLARVMRRELKKRDILHVKVLSSTEEPVDTSPYTDDKRTPGSVSFVPSVGGLLIAGEVIRDLLQK